MVTNSAARKVNENAAETSELEALVRQVADAAWDRKALGLRVLDIRGLVSYTDFLVICSGNSDRQVGAISDSIEQSLRESGIRALGIEGRQGNRWVLMDYGDVIIHLFTEAERDVYGLDSLWNDAPGLDVEAPPDLERPTYY